MTILRHCPGLILALLPLLSHGAPASLREGMDNSIAAGDDFYAYANGDWARHTAIPEDQSGVGPFEELDNLTRLQVIDLIRELSHVTGMSADSRKVADYYAAYMDDAGIEAKGLDPLKPAFLAIDRIANIHDLSHYLGTTLRADVDITNDTNLFTPRLFGLWVAQDMDSPDRYAAFLLQGGLGMPDREYYLDSSARMRQLQRQYQTHIATVLHLLGDSDARATGEAKRIYALEKALAGKHVSRQESEDVQRGHNHRTNAELGREAPGMDWEAFWSGADVDPQANTVIWQPAAVAGIATLIAGTPLGTWKAYLRYHAADEAADFLPKAFTNENFRFYENALKGTPQRGDRWKRAIDFTNVDLGEAVGKLYVEKHFPAQTKLQIQAMVKNLLTAFAAHIDALDWMTASTKATAKAKLATLKVAVGYPDHWRDYGALQIHADDAYGNHQRAQRFEYRRNIAKLGQPIDRDEWCMAPQVVNAVNLPVMNALNFPAAMLQAPAFDASWPDSVNYGSIGAIIGHEISHSFDDQGAQFDATGRLHNWWTPDDYAHFKASGDQLAAQFDTYRPFPDLSVNGRLTLSENIADLGGLAAAHSALHLSMQGNPGEIIENLTPDQQFFVAYARTWRGKYREAALRRQIVTNGHAPGQYRAQTVRNIDTWYASFNVTSGQKLYLDPAARVRIWQ